MQEVTARRYAVEDQFGHPHVVAEYAPGSWVVDNLAGLGLSSSGIELTRQEIEARYPEALAAWEAGDDRAAVRSRVSLHMSEVREADGINNIVTAAETILAYGLVDDSPAYATIVRHLDALREVKEVVNAEFERVKEVERSDEQDARRGTAG